MYFSLHIHLFITVEIIMHEMSVKTSVSPKNPNFSDEPFVFLIKAPQTVKGDDALVIAYFKVTFVKGC